MNTFYCAGRKARQQCKHYTNNPHGRRTQSFYQWCAGWNDEDIRLGNVRYFVNDTSRLVRTDDSNTYQPTGDWREVTLPEWVDFRAATKKVKRK